MVEFRGSTTTRHTLPSSFNFIKTIYENRSSLLFMTYQTIIVRGIYDYALVALIQFNKYYVRI